MDSDPDLLRRYAEDRSEAAFAELVRRHVNLVYFSALRQVGGDAHRAQDVAQGVFTDLARKARSLTKHTTLTGWLHTSTRYAAATLRRTEANRQKYEQEAEAMHDALRGSESTANWDRLRPMIDDALHELNERDREAVLLRFFEGRAFAEIGAVLNVSEDGARMRVDRALEKLGGVLSRRGVKSTGAALAVAFANQAGANAPAGIAGAITSAVLASAGAGGVVAGTGIFMSNTSTLIVSAVALAAIGSTFFQWNHVQRTEAELAALTLDRDRIRAQADAEQRRTARFAKEIASLQDEIGLLKAKKAETAAAPIAKEAGSSPTAVPDATIGLAHWEIQQGALNNLKQIDAARKYFRDKQGKLATSIHELVGRQSLIKTVRSVAGEDYSKLSMNPDDAMTVTTPSGIAVTFDPAGTNTTRPDIPPEVARVQEMAPRLQPLITQAVNAYRAATGKNPADERALIPYFATPKDGADFVEFLEAKKTAGL